MSHRRFVQKAALLGLVLAAGLAASAAAGVPADEADVEKILGLVSPSVVKIEARNGVRKVATGVVIDAGGTVVTTALIFSPRDKEISVRTFDGKKLEAAFKGFDTSTGLAVLALKAGGPAPVALGTSADVRPGVPVWAIGFSPENTPAVTQGIVSSAAEDRFRLNLWVTPGSSGAPVVNSAGRLVGILRGTYFDEQPVFFEFREQQVVGSGTVFSRAEAPSSGMALAVPVDVVRSVAGDILKAGKVERGWIGVQVVEKETGLEITAVEPKSPAELAKLRAGDVIVRVGGTDIASGSAFSREIRKRKPGTEVVLGLKRDGDDREVKVKLGEFTAEDGRRELELRFPRLFPGPSPATPEPGRRGQVFAWESRRYIGLTLQPLTKDLAAYFGAGEGTGLLVAGLDPDGPALKAGLKAGDVILKADGRPMETVADLSSLVRDKKAGETVKLTVLREKKTLTVEVAVAEDKTGAGGPEAFFRNLPEGAGRGWTAFPDRLKKTMEEFGLDGSMRPAGGGAGGTRI